MSKGVASFVVEELGEGLVVASPVRPVQHLRDQHARTPKQSHEEAAHFRHTDPDQAAAATGSSPRLFLNVARAAWLAAGLAKSRARVIRVCMRVCQSGKTR